MFITWTGCPFYPCNKHMSISEFAWLILLNEHNIDCGSFDECTTMLN